MSNSHEALHRRYGDAAFAASDEWNAVIDQLLDHRSVRAFTDEPLAEGTLDTLMAAAQSAATSSNLQTVSVVAVTNPARKEKLSEWAGGQKHIIEAPLFLVWLADLSRFDRIAEQQDVSLEALPYFENTLLATIDTALAAQNATVALESLGLGAVYVGGIRNHIDWVSEELNLPQHVYPVFGMSIGHPDPERPTSVRPRLPKDAILHHEQYFTDAEPGLIDQYDDILRAFYQSQNMRDASWTEQMVKRLRSVKSLSHREVLAQLIKERGFSLD